MPIKKKQLASLQISITQNDKFSDKSLKTAILNLDKTQVNFFKRIRINGIQSIAVGFFFCQGRIKEATSEAYAEVECNIINFTEKKDHRSFLTHKETVETFCQNISRSASYDVNEGNCLLLWKIMNTALGKITGAF